MLRDTDINFCFDFSFLHRTWSWFPWEENNWKPARRKWKATRRTTATRTSLTPQSLRQPPLRLRRKGRQRRRTTRSGTHLGSLTFGTMQERKARAQPLIDPRHPAWPTVDSTTCTKPASALTVCDTTFLRGLCVVGTWFTSIFRHLVKKPLL